MTPNVQVGTVLIEDRPLVPGSSTWDVCLTQPSGQRSRPSTKRSSVSDGTVILMAEDLGASLWPTLPFEPQRSCDEPKPTSFA
jgi:hypothetical protein